MSKGYSSYSKRFMDYANFYIKDGELIKNRGKEFTNKENEISNYNNIAIEEKGVINIYCKDSRVQPYQQEIEHLKQYCTFINDKVIIHKE